MSTETPDQVSARMNQAIADAKAGIPIVTPHGSWVTNSFGPGIIGDPDLGVAAWTGTGRTSAFVLADGQTEGICVLRDLGDWHDARFGSLAFYGNGNGVPLVDLSGYSINAHDLFFRGNLQGSKVPQSGLRVRNGQHYILTNVQAEKHERNRN